MQEVTHQTVKLAKGRHTSPEHGACVMELASMLAGEQFSDHPRSVSRTIAAFLRMYNDLLDDEGRQDLYEYAAKTVGSAARAEVERERVERLIAWGDEMWRLRARRSIRGRLERRRAHRLRARDPEAAARYGIRAIRKLSGDGRGTAPALVDGLIEMGSGLGSVPPTRLPPLARAAASAPTPL
jgi:hypothetical protein